MKIKNRVLRTLEGAAFFYSSPEGTKLTLAPLVLLHSWTGKQGEFSRLQFATSPLDFTKSYSWTFKGELNWFHTPNIQTSV